MVQSIDPLHIAQHLVQIVGPGKNRILRCIPDEEGTRSDERENVRPIERNARDVRKISAKLWNEGGGVRPTLRIWIAPERGEAAACNGCRNPRLESCRKQSSISAVRMTDA